MECDAVHQSTGHPEAWEDNSEACDVDAVNSKSGLFCYRCGGQGHIAAKRATPAPTKGKGKDGGKEGKAGGEGGGNKGKGKEEWSGFCSYCGKKGHGRRDCWTTQKDEAINGRQTSGRLRKISADSKSAAWTKKKCSRQGCIFSNRFQALNDGDAPNLCPVEKQWTGGKITVDSGGAESVWPAGLMPEIQTKPSVGSQTGVTYIAASGNRMPNLGEKKVHFKTKDGLNSSITFQVTKVKKPLAAVSKKGN